MNDMYDIMSHILFFVVGFIAAIPAVLLFTAPARKPDSQIAAGKPLSPDAIYIDGQWQKYIDG